MTLTAADIMTTKVNRNKSDDRYGRIGLGRRGPARSTVSKGEIARTGYSSVQDKTSGDGPAL